MLICSISGERAVDPVISPKSGQIYERKLIEKYITENGVEPSTNEALTKEELIVVKSMPAVNPRTPSTTSIPSLMSIFQNEWDALMLETFQLKQSYNTVKQELSQALYSHDAACRVIARLKKERDYARQALATLQESIQAGTAGTANNNQENGTESSKAPEAMDVDNETETDDLPEDVLQVIEKTHAELSSLRRQRKPAPDAITPEDFPSNVVATKSFNAFHSNAHPGILCMDVHKTHTNMIVTGGLDKSIQVFDLTTEKKLPQLKGHTKRINEVAWHPSELCLASAGGDKTIRVWTTANEKDTTHYNCVHTLKQHSDEIQSVTFHPSGSYILAASEDCSWSMTDLSTGKLLTHVSQPQKASGYSAASTHPDGTLYGIGTYDGMIQIWDIRTRKKAIDFKNTDMSLATEEQQISSLSFSENGYFLASASLYSNIKVWDLRKLTDATTITLDPLENGSKSKINSVCWNDSGRYLAVAGSDMRVYANKSWSLLGTFQASSDLEYTKAMWGDKASSSLVTCGMDRVVRVWEVPS